MAVMAREAWTDERLDDLKENVNQRFDQVDKRFDKVDKRLDEVVEQVDKRFELVDHRFDRVEADIRELQKDVKHGFESVHRMLIIGFVTMSASICASVIGGVIAAMVMS